MNWLEGMNRALTYIETNLEEDLPLEKIAACAYSSTYHFLRMFHMITGVPVSEYIRRRRLTKAAFDLQNSKEKIIDIALKYGYSSPTAFNRAFQKQHGTTPSEMRKRGVNIVDYPKLSFQVQLKGEIELNYKIIEREAFQVIGFKIATTMTEDECYREIPLFWRDCFLSGKVNQLFSRMNEENDGVLGISASDDFVSNPDFDYYIAVASQEKPPKGMEEYIIPAATWAVFETKGENPRAIQELQKRVLTEWLPTSGYEYDNKPDIEVYPEGDQSDKEYSSFVWLPIRKQQ